jgi:hypothetical protein
MNAKYNYKNVANVPNLKVHPLTNNTNNTVHLFAPVHRIVITTTTTTTTTTTMEEDVDQGTHNPQQLLFKNLPKPTPASTSYQSFSNYT